MGERLKYRKKSTQFVTAVQIDLDIAGFEYQKWGAKQRAKKGDWLVDNHGDVYTVDANVFASTYKMIEPGKFVKVTAIWAEVATKDGSVKTREGESHYSRGDYIVSNQENGD